MSGILNLEKKSGILDLAKVAPSLSKLRGVLNWDAHPVHAKSLSQGFDLDIFVFALNKDSKISGGDDVGFFNNKNALGGAVQIPVDNRTGDGHDDEYVLVNLGSVPADKTALDVFVFIFDAAARQQNFGMVANAQFQLINEETKEIIQSYSLNQHVSSTAIHLGRISRNGSGWNFEPVGEAASADPNEVAAAYM